MIGNVIGASHLAGASRCWPQAFSEFPGLAHWIEEQDLKITLLAFVPDVLPDTFMGFKGEWDSKALLAPYSEMLETLDSLSEKAKSHIDSVHGFPLCAIPEDLAHLVRGRLKVQHVVQNVRQS